MHSGQSKSSRRNVSSKEMTSVYKKAIQKRPRKQIKEAKQDTQSSKETEEIVRLSSYPSFAKLMKQSHVIRGFWLGLPTGFCKEHLPLTAPAGKKGPNVVLVDNGGKEYITIYLPYKTGLSGGWQGFSKDHKLVEGDELVFQLIKPCTFKVSIIKLKEGSQNTHQTVLAQSDQLPRKRTHQMVFSRSSKLPMEDQIPYRVVKPKTTKIALEDFKIIVDGVEFDSKIPPNTRTKYHDLCTTHKEYLHCRLSMAYKQECKIIVDMITDIVNIADSIRAAEVTTPLEELEKWSKTLGGFEDHGMSVGFLRVRISQLFHQHSRKTKMYQIKLKEQAKLEMQTEEFDAEVTNGRDAHVLDKEIKTLKAKVAKAELAFQELANAP